jgi:hypothetical protein
MRIDGNEKARELTRSRSSQLGHNFEGRSICLHIVKERKTSSRMNLSNAQGWQARPKKPVSRSRRTLGDVNEFARLHLASSDRLCGF